VNSVQNDKQNVGVNIEAEQALIGAVLVENSCFNDAAHIQPDYFYEPTHSLIWRSITDSMNKGGVASIPQILTAISSERSFLDMGGVGYLMLMFERGYPFAVVSYAEAVLEAWAKRSLNEVAQNAIILASSGKPSVDAISYLRGAIQTIEANAVVSDAEFQKAPDVASRVVEKVEKMRAEGRVFGRRTGLNFIDRRLGGLHGGELIIIGGRPSMGKTTLARAIAHGCAVNNPDHLVSFMGIEMGPEEMMQRELSYLTYHIGKPVPYRDMRQGKVSADDVEAMAQAKFDTPKNLILQDVPNLSLDDVRRSVWSLKKKGPLAAIIIDYLQIMARPDNQGRNDAAVIGSITKGLKQIARQADCAVVLLSQLSRKVEEREDKRPNLSDLRESGSIEQDADVVMFPFREVYYLERTTPKESLKTEHDYKIAEIKNIIEIIYAKTRASGIGTEMAYYDAPCDIIRDK